MDIRLIALDIDGTIAGESNSVREPVKQALQAAQSQGIAVTVATGRMFRSALHFYQEIGGNTPLIAYNGAWVQDPLLPQPYQHLPVSPAIALRLLNALENPDRREQIQIHCYIDDQLYVREITADTERYAERSRTPAIAVGDLRHLIHQPTTKILAMGQDQAFMLDLLQQLRHDFPSGDLHLTQSTTTFFEATHPLANKGNALRYLTEEILRLTSNNVLAIGDNFNDHEMLDYAGIGVAMGNAPEAIKAIANWVAPDVETDGVVAALQQFVL